MIATISGRVILIYPDSVVVDIQGLGFEVFITRTLAAELTVGDTCSVYTHMVVRQDDVALYGFEDLDEKALFVQLLGVGGIGPRLAMAILSNLSMDNIRRAIINEQPEFFSRVPGVGKKTAQKILIHMQGKVPQLEGDLARRSSSADDSVLEALVGLGYSVVEAQAAIQALPKDTPDTVEDKLRIALQYFDH